MEPVVEQRQHRRHPVDMQGVISSATVKGEDCVVLDISMGGCRVTSEVAIPAGATIQLQIKPRQAAPIYVPSAAVRWISGTAFGVQFQEVPERE
jgi:hypothetical protein